ncbi:MAG: hypothetical protein J6S21_05290 [Victivallales bacterium]|nr:hypothetical protein [Victivallales bacterium]
MNTFAFFDDFCLQQRHQMKRRFFTQKIIEGSGYNDPNFRAAYSTLAYVPEQDRYLMWANFNTVFADINAGVSEHCLMALAESSDGIHYQPIKDGLKGYGNISNVVFNGKGNSVHGATVLFDPNDPEPARRFKCAAALDEPGDIMAYAPCHIAFSPDGKNWTLDGNKHIWSHYWSDTYNALIYNPVLQCYQVFCRAVGTDRRICTVLSKDLVNWSEPQCILHPGPLDPPGTEFYGMPVFYHQGIFYGYLWPFDTDDEDPVAYKMTGRMRTELAYSYDGLNWNRTYQPVLDMKDYDSDGYGVFQNTIYNTILNREQDKWLSAVTLTRGDHGAGLYKDKDGNHLPPASAHGDNTNSVRLIAEMKPGRFCGLESIGLSGRIRTKNMVMKRGGVFPTINVACPYGEMRVRLCNTRNQPLPGFDFQDCVPFRGDELAWKPLWKERRIEETEGKFFNMEIELNGGCIFGISGDLLPHHSALPQYGYGDVRSAALDVHGTLEKAPDYDALEMH